VTAGLVLVALVVTARYTLRRGPRAGYLLVAVSIAWLLVDKSMEGVTLVTFTGDRGLTAADLAGLAGIGLGLHQAWPDLVQRWHRLLAAVRS
jgi:hypothetical protein